MNIKEFGPRGHIPDTPLRSANGNDNIGKRIFQQIVFFSQIEEEMLIHQ